MFRDGAAHADAIEAVKQFLQGCDLINNLSVSKSVKSNRIYFLLDRFDQATTVDGHANNWRIQSEGTRTSRADRWIPFGSQYERPPRAARRSDLIAATALPIRLRAMIFDVAALIACAADVCTAGPTCMYGPSHRLAASPLK
jgi:hypothetical protein